ncbi:uncharacterized protein LOC113859394 [Abrus precatorius]|uniref:Uncharacterized protein LOC113859394 n=1 Tax=Abrus precatorius TaxID=3816 RepID=A0A8B8KXA9_ABRPR|nr:uncharacterized protein LOC113859394 [Abrus precatorius]
MGSLLHIFEFNQGRMAKKVHAHKKSNDALETPRSSVELQVETSQVHCPEGELPYTCQVEDGWSKNYSYSNVVSVEKMNNEKLSKQSGTRNNAPSLVARLMGIDTMPLPLDTKSVVPSDESKHENLETMYSKKEMDGKGLVGRGSSNFNSSSQMEFDSLCQDIVHDDGWTQKPRPREHPQEKELKKFKKEFEAYKAARFKECSEVVEIGSVSRQILGQENLRKEKMQHDARSKRDSHSFQTKLPNGDVMESISTKRRESFPSRSRTLSRDFEESLVMKSRSRLDICSSPAQIVILKPGSDRICNCNHEESCISVSGTLQGKKGIEDFLEEVRERLKCEMQGKTAKKGSLIRASELGTPYNEKPYVRSESARSFKSEIQFNAPSSPEFFNRDTGRFLSERLRNTVKSNVHFDIPAVACGNSRSYTVDNGRIRLKQKEDTMKCAIDMNQWEILEVKKEIQTGSYRHKLDDNVLLHKELSPRNLVRSLSAPVSGTSFGKLLLEDCHLITGAHIQRKLEAVEEMPIDVKKWKKDKFSIKEKVSNFKHILGLRGKLFGKRLQTIVESHGNEYGPILRDIRSGPTVLMKYGERNENSTEVPPSPASVCSCAQEENWRQIDYLSPISTPDVSSLDDIVIPKVFRDISSGLIELRRQLNQLDSDGVEDFTMKEDPFESELVQLDDPAESYVRDLLVASGLYFGSWDKSLLRGDTLAKPIGNSVFEEVEESHKILVKENEIFIKDQNKLEHKVLLDLLNEALSIVLGSTLPLSRFRKKLSNSCMQPPPYGKELLKLVWDIIRVSLSPPSYLFPCSFDSLVAQDLGPISWYGLMNDQINILETQIECLITDDLVEELTKDMLLGIV